MDEQLSERILGRIEQIAELYHRLILVVAPNGSGKTGVMQEIAVRTRSSLVNLNLVLAERLLDLTERQRTLQLPRVLADALASDEPIVLLDNIEILFDVSLQQDPLRLLQGVSRSRTVIASWSGMVDKGYLLYAAPDHPEYRRYPSKDLVLERPEVAE